MILAPTRELATQIEASLAPLAQPLGLAFDHRVRRREAGPPDPGATQGVDIVIACPGRLEDLIGSGHADLGAIEITVLDEADHMADLGLPAGA